MQRVWVGLFVWILSSCVPTKGTPPHAPFWPGNAASSPVPASQVVLPPATWSSPDIRFLGGSGDPRLKDFEGGFRQGVTFSPDGKYLVVQRYDTLEILDPSTGEALPEENKRLGGAKVSPAGGPSLCFSSEGATLFFLSENDDLYRWDLNAQDPPSLFLKDLGWGWCESLTRSNRLVSQKYMLDTEWGGSLSFDSSDAFAVWDAATGDKLWEARPREERQVSGERGLLHKKYPYTFYSPFGVLPDGRQALIAVWKGTEVQRRDYRYHTESATLEIHDIDAKTKRSIELDDWPRKILSSSDSKRVLLLGWDCSVSAWDISNTLPSKRREIKYPIDPASPKDCPSIGALSSDGHFAAVGGQFGIDLWDLERGKRLWRQLWASPMWFAPVFDTALRFTPDDKALLLTGDQSLRLVGIPKGDVLFRVPYEGEIGNELGGVTIDVASKRVAILLEDRLELFSYPPKEPLLPDRSTISNLQFVTISPDGEWVASLDDTGVRLWEAKTGKERWAVGGFTQNPTSLRFSGDGRELYALTKKEEDNFFVAVWDVATGAFVREVKSPGRIKAAAFLPSPNRAVVEKSGQQGLLVWDLKKNTKVEHWPAAKSKLNYTELGEQYPQPEGMLFLDDEHVLARGMDTSEVELWSLREGKLLKRLLEQEEHIDEFVLSPDQTRILLTGRRRANSIRERANPIPSTSLWNLSSGEMLNQVPDCWGGASFSLEGVVALVCGTKIHLWRAETGEEIDALDFSQNKDWISSVFFVDASTLWVGTKKGFLYRFALSGL